MRAAVLTSTGGAVVEHAARDSAALRDSLALFVSDRPCGGLRLAEDMGIGAVIIDERDNNAFSERLLAALQAARIDYVYVFFTRLLQGRLLDTFSNRLVNFHPSLLPACPGLDGFGDSLASGALVIGSTVHFIDRRTDAGPQIIQALLPVAPGTDRAQLRHRIFVQQCRSLIQVHEWLADGRIDVRNGHALVRGAAYETGEFVPGIESPTALGFSRPYLPAT